MSSFLSHEDATTLSDLKSNVPDVNSNVSDVNSNVSDVRSREIGRAKMSHLKTQNLKEKKMKNVRYV